MGAGAQMARRNPYGVHYIPTHQRKAHYDHMRDSAPGLVKLVSSNGAPDVQQMADCYAAAPNAIHVYRNHPLSEQHDDLWSNPVGTAVRHASTWQHELRIRRDEAKRRKLTLPPMEQTSVLGINEPVIELFPRQEDGSNYDEWLAMVRQRAHLLDLYMSTWVWECVKYGQPCHVGNFSGGQPANLRPGEYATYDWFPKTRAAMEATRGMSALAVHEYWDVPGPNENPDWWTYRFFHCDWAIDTIDVLETGVDRAIRSHQYEGTRGYAGHMNGQAYVRQLATYMRGCLRDSRFRCATPFTLDGDKMWESFWIDPILDEMTALSREMQQAVASHNPPNVGGNSPSVPGAGHKAYLPHVGNQQSNSNSGSNPQPSPEVEPPKKNAMSSNSGAIDPLVLEAIIKVESGGQAYGPDGRPLIRFEAHIFLARQGHNRFRHNTDKPWTGQQVLLDGWRDIHTGSQQDEYNAFEIARAANARAAYESISVGLGQIMGFNHARIGYPSAEAMYNAFARSEAAQVIGLINFFLSDPQLTQAARSKDWRTIARLYNGPGDVDRVAPLLQRTYEGLRNA